MTVASGQVFSFLHLPAACWQEGTVSCNSYSVFAHKVTHHR